MVGQTLGPYVIIDRLGGGGMGEVFRARDPRLDRLVALKVLAPRFVADEAARSRFEFEARAVAALSHPNVLAIHDFGVQDGLAYTVSELLEGETLRARMNAAGGPLPLHNALDVAIQIARGMAAAHEKGIAHRDLKPENVFVVADGQVKILDFGIARRQTRPEHGDESLTVVRDTEPGMTLGTVGYMSPEQVRGEPGDHRSDIFSFGCVLFEMVTGRRAFDRGSRVESMTAILRDDPLAITAEAVGLPPALEQVIRHCLEKRPAERYQSARDLAFSIQSLSAASPVAASVPPVARRRPRAAGWALGASALAVIGLIGLAWWPKPAPVLPAEPRSFQQVTDTPGVETWPTLSPDGRQVVFASDSAGNLDLYSLRVGGRNAVPLTADSRADDSQPAFSPDGNRIAFRSEREGGGVFVMDATGESVRRIADVGYAPAWSPDGTDVVLAGGFFRNPTDAAAGSRQLWVVSVATGARREIATAVVAFQPNWSPGGTRIAYWGVRGGSGQRDIWTVAADGSDGDTGGIAVTDDAALDWSPVWSPDGTGIYFSSARGGTLNLWRIAIDERTGRTQGEPEPVTVPATWCGFFSFSRDGSRLAFASLDWRSALLRAPFDAARGAAGRAEPILRGTLPIRDHEISPDGQWVAFTEIGVREDVFLSRIDGTQYRRLTDDEARDRGVTWLPDGSRLLFYSDRAGGYGLFGIRPDGSRLERVGSWEGVGPVVSPDGQRVAFVGTAPSQGQRAWSLAAASADPPDADLQPSPSDTESFLPASWSKDGTRIVGQLIRAEGDITGLAVFDVASRTFKRVPGRFAQGAWVVPAWIDDQRLLLRRPDGIFSIDLADGSGQRLVQVGGFMLGRSVGVSRDGRWISYTETGTEGDVWVATFER